MNGFRRLTRQQRAALRALISLGEVVVMPSTAKPLKALSRRGWVRYRRVDGVRTAVLYRALERRWCAWREYEWWPNQDNGA